MENPPLPLLPDPYDSYKDAVHLYWRELRDKGTPILPAYHCAGGFYVWCEHCGHYHHHAPVPGPRVAHCTVQTPYKQKGYYLFYAGEIDPEIVRYNIRARNLSEGKVRSKRFGGPGGY